MVSLSYKIDSINSIKHTNAENLLVMYEKVKYLSKNAFCNNFKFFQLTDGYGNLLTDKNSGLLADEIRRLIIIKLGSY